ncbi:MAG: DUF1553 domain-containing protein [Verrucomicrobiales bacterium]|nr:DUF1553 domain-containing protein [Verrucomicrobiales bacterium]
MIEPSVIEKRDQPRFRVASAIRNVTQSSPVLSAIAATTVMLASSLRSSAAESSIAFNRDVRPILSDNCFACHGPDPGTRKGGLRLDTKEGMYDRAPKREPAVVPGRPADSTLWTRIMTTDPDDVMPPPKSHKELKPEQKAVLKRWIEQGAPWQSHWSLIKPERGTVPTPTKLADRVRNPIDNFVFAKLEEKGLSPAPEADRRTLARRLALDLTGLPPRAEEVEAFVRDRSADFYEKYVNRLLESPRWGEHRGRYWLDAARYADTHGLHFDNYREMWPYRDWVIAAFNRNQPFDQFTLEQLAGDLLPGATQDQKVATGFHRCNPTTNEGGTIDEENLANYARDRVETTSWVWLGLTANCAVCHDHKFDPITMKDFYSMSAFFRNTVQPGRDGNVKDSSPHLILMKTEAEQARWKALPGEIETARKPLEALRTNSEPQFAAWLNTLKPASIEAGLTSKGLIARIPLAGKDTNRVAWVNDKGATNWVNTTGKVTLREGGKLGTAPQFNAQATAEFKKLGDFDRQDAFTCSTWVFVPGDYEGRAVVLSRMEEDEPGKRRGWDIQWEHRHYSIHLIHDWPNDAIRLRTRNQSAGRGSWQHLTLTYDGSSRPEGVRLYVDGNAVEIEVDRVRQLSGSIRTRQPLKLAQHATGNHLDGLSLQDVRLYSRALASEEVRLVAQAKSLEEWLQKPASDRKPEPRKTLLDYYLVTEVEAYRVARQSARALERERDGLRMGNPGTHVQQESTNAMGIAHVLSRGQYDKPKEKVEPAVFAALNPLPEGAPKNRLGLAQWLISSENPLAARVTVNRFWQEVFGVGLAKTSEDLGIMGEAPSNQALLDWLAVEFREKGWNVKEFFKLMVTSATYRQSANTTPEKLEKDPFNRWLSRGPRFRMDAEMVRDYALAASGLLAPRIGGPSDRPYQPGGVWEAVAMPESNTRYYHEDSGESLYRRSLYTFWKRAAPPANMEIFNAPSRETSCLRRERTNTPLQALATLNDPQFMEAARHLAVQALRSGRRDPRKGLDALARAVLARPLTSEEEQITRTGLERFLEYYAAHPEEARALIEVGDSPANRKEKAELIAAWTMTANQFFNLDEALNK